MNAKVEEQKQASGARKADAAAAAANQAARLLRFTSHIDGRNATLSVYPDRVEWERPRGVGLTNKSGTEMIPVKAISSVTTKKDGFTKAKLVMIVSGNTIEARLSPKEADEAKQTLTALILGTHPSQQQPTSTALPSATAAAPPDLSSQLKQLAELHAAGALSEAEFATAKARLFEA